MSPTRHIINCTNDIYIFYVDGLLKPYAHQRYELL